MNKKQENRFNMYLTTVNFCGTNTAITAPLPSFSRTLNSLTAVCDRIHLIAETQAATITGTTVDKNNKGETLVVLSADTARKLAAFAQLGKNQILLEEINYTETDLRRLPDPVLPGTAQLIYDRAQTNLASLADYQITDETQAALLQAITQYKQALASPRIEKTNQVQTTKQLAEEFIKGDEALVNMDTVVEIVRLTQPNFYLGYKMARKIIVTGKTKLAIKGLVTDELTGEPLRGVVISFWPDGQVIKPASTGKAALVKKTAAKGGFNVSSLRAGTYKVTAQKAGYAEQALTIFVNDGELTTVDIKLAKA